MTARPVVSAAGAPEQSARTSCMRSPSAQMRARPALALARTQDGPETRITSDAYSAQFCSGENATSRLRHLDLRGLARHAVRAEAVDYHHRYFSRCLVVETALLFS